MCIRDRPLYRAILSERKRLSAFHAYYEQMVDLGDEMQAYLTGLQAAEECAAWQFYTRRTERLHNLSLIHIYWTAIGLMMVWSCFTTVLLVVFPAPLFRIFIQEDYVLPIGVSYLRIMGYSQILMCLEITSSGAFQGLGRPMPPTLAGIIGNAARIPMAIALSATVLGLDGIWWSISISSIAKGAVVFVWFLVVLRRYLHSSGPLPRPAGRESGAP